MNVRPDRSLLDVLVGILALALVGAAGCSRHADEGEPTSESSVEPSSAPAAPVAPTAQPPKEALEVAEASAASPVVVRKPEEGELERLGVLGWPTWDCEPQTFPWHYERKEVCYILEGKVTVEAEGTSVTFGPGDVVVFPAGLDCVWKIEEAVRKHYTYEE